MNYEVKEILAPRPFIRSSLDIFSKHVKKDRSILDIGCRDGWSCEYLKELGYKKILGIEIYRPFVEHAKKMERPVEEGDAEDLKQEDSSFDAIFSRHTLEHVKHPDKALKEFNRVLKKEGLLFLTLPLEDKPSERSYHLCCFPTIEELKQAVEKAGFDIQFSGMSKEKGIAPINEEALIIAKKQ